VDTGSGDSVSGRGASEASGRSGTVVAAVLAGPRPGLCTSHRNRREVLR
jgi:hypothetical protein